MLKILFSFVLLCVAWTQAEIPDYIKVCKRNDPEISQCIIDSITQLRGKLYEGIEELHVPVADPLKIESVSITDGLNINITDLVFRGLVNFDIKSFKAEISKNRFAVLLHYPEINIQGTHFIDMNILTVPFKGSGTLNIDLTEVNVAAKLKGKIEKRNQKKYLKFEPFDFQIILSGKKDLGINGLFKNNPTLEKAAKAVLQDNVDILVEEFLPGITKTLSKTFTDIANKITSNFEYDELFPI